jgi:tetratricopeptide (TPR) repeat protein
MKWSLIAFLVCLSGVAFAAPEKASDPFLAAIDKKLERLNRVAGSYPPAVTKARERNQVVRECNEAARSLERELAKHPASWDIEWRLGECYRIGHNLDIRNAWKRSEAHLKKAISLRPEEARAYLILGMLYVNSDQSLAPEAEKLFKKALQLSGSQPMAAAHEGLVFAYYYQGRFTEALKEADEYLAQWPKDKKMLAVREVVRKMAARSGQKTP